MRMDTGLDTGPMLLGEAMPIGADDTAATLQDRLARLGARLIVEALARGPSLQAHVQPAEGVTYAHKIDKAEAVIDWQRPAAVIERRLRAFDPFPGCTAEMAGQPLKVWRGRVAQVDAEATPGSVLSAGPGRLVVACGGPARQALEILEVQVPGGRRMPAREWLQRAGAAPH